MDRFAQVLDRLAQARSGLLSRLVGLILRRWQSAPPTPQGRQQFAQDAAAIVRTAQRSYANVTVAAHSKMLTELGTPSPSPSASLPINEQAKPDQWEVLAQRLEAISAEQDAAATQAIIEEQAAEDLDSASRSVRDATLAGASDHVVGFRRVVHPERSAGGSCGLCVVASTRIYTTPKLKPIHDGCHCTVLPITAAEDPGGFLNLSDLGEAYAAAGGTTHGWMLKRVRYDADGEVVSQPKSKSDGGKGPTFKSAWDDLKWIDHQIAVIEPLKASSWRTGQLAKLRKRREQLTQQAERKAM